MASSKTARELGDRLADLSRGKRPRDEYAIYVSHMIDRALEEERAAWRELHLAAREVVMHMGKKGILTRLDRAVARVKEFLPREGT